MSDAKAIIDHDGIAGRIRAAVGMSLELEAGCLEDLLITFLK